MEEKIAPWDMLQTAMELKVYTEQIWDTYDLDGGGTIDFNEAYDLVRDTIGDLKIDMVMNKDDFINFFEHLDKDGNKTLSQKEMAIFLLSLKRGQYLTDDQSEQVCNYLGFEDNEGGSQEQII